MTVQMTGEHFDYPLTSYPLSEQDVTKLYEMRRDRLAHPHGDFDKGGRWYPSTLETASCCASVRSPSRAHPYSYMVHCRSHKHLATWFAEHREFIATARHVLQFISEYREARVFEVMAELDLSLDEVVTILRAFGKAQRYPLITE